MALPASGAISFGDIATEWSQAASNVNLAALYKSPGGSIVTAGDTAPNVPTVPGNAISLDNFHGAARVPPTTVDFYPTSYTLIDTWSSPANAYAVDGSVAQVATTGDGTELLYNLTGYNWSSIPSGAYINSVVLHVKARTSGSGGLTGGRLHDGTTQWCQASTTATTLTEVTATVGAGMTRAQLLNTYVVVYGLSAPTARISYIDCAWVVVTYQ